jgi:very-short-patch-repair endonuclease
MSSPYQRRQSSQRQHQLAGRAQFMRQHLTASEARLWAELRGSRLGIAFRRQVVIGRYIADFCAPSAGLVVEVDGGSHQGRTHLDQRRDEHLRRAGYRVVRIPAALVTADVRAAVSLLRTALSRIA